MIHYRQLRTKGDRTMTVKELMERLAQFDENTEVKIVDGDWEEELNYVEDHEGTIILQSIK